MGSGVPAVGITCVHRLPVAINTAAAKSGPMPAAAVAHENSSEYTRDLWPAQDPEQRAEAWLPSSTARWPCYAV